jgi:hypothetical protein
MSHWGNNGYAHYGKFLNFKQAKFRIVNVACCSQKKKNQVIIPSTIHHPMKIAPPPKMNSQSVVFFFRLFDVISLMIISRNILLI